MAKCGACQRECRVTRLANVAGDDGGMRRARVCKKCFDGALHIVARIVRTEKPKDEVKEARRDAAAVVKAAVKKLRAFSHAYEGDQAHGIEIAIDVLEAGDY